MNSKKDGGGGYFNRLIRDGNRRVFVTAAISFFTTLAFCCYNVFLGIAYGVVWNWCIAVYFALLLGIRAFVIFSEIKFYKDKLPDDVKALNRKNLYLVQSTVLLVLDVALIAPVSLMVMQMKAVAYSGVPAIAVAAYTTYKIISATVNYLKTGKINILSVKILRKVNLIDALVSVLSLQYTMVMTFGDGVVGEMFKVCAVTSFLIWGLTVVVSVFSIYQAVKLKKK